MILTQSQAETVYRAICELNNICAVLSASFIWDDEIVTVQEFRNGQIRVGYGHTDVETYEHQGAFRDAYGLDGGA